MGFELIDKMEQEYQSEDPIPTSTTVTTPTKKKSRKRKVLSFDADPDATFVQKLAVAVKVNAAAAASSADGGTVELANVSDDKVLKTKRRKVDNLNGDVSNSYAKSEPKPAALLDQLINLDSAKLIVNMTQIDCPVCLCETAPGDGVTLKDCLHSYCRSCLVMAIEYCEEAAVKCPFRNEAYTCDSPLRQSEIRALVAPAVFEKYLSRSVAQAEGQTESYHCKTPDCPGWCLRGDHLNAFLCPICDHVNCVSCRAIHELQSCLQYQESISEVTDSNAAAARVSLSLLEDMVACGVAMTCPVCEAVVEKAGGCDWLVCALCKTELCWVTRNTRWGPGGKGDTSAGCQCGLNGRKCHRECSYCH